MSLTRMTTLAFLLLESLCSVKNGFLVHSETRNILMTLGRNAEQD